MFGTRTRTVADDAATTTTAGSSLWSPAQLVAIVIGIASIVFGALALSKTGLDLDHIKTPHDSFAGFHHTPLLALVEIVFGALLVLSGLRPVAGRSIMTILGVCALGLGVVLVVNGWHHILHVWLGAHGRNGWLFIGAGGVLLLASLLPIFGGNRRTVVRERVVDD